MIYKTLIPIYNIKLICCQTLKELDKEVLKDCPEYYREWDTVGRMVAWWASKESNYKIAIMAVGYPELAHECCHAAHEVFHHIEQKPELLNDEVYCYLVEWLFKTYITHIKFKKRK